MDQAQSRRPRFLSVFLLVLLALAGLAAGAEARSVYVANLHSDDVSAIDTQTHQAVGTPIAVGEGPEGIAITPDGKTAYVANFHSNDVSAIDVQAGKPVGSPIRVGADPSAIAIAPDGKTAYVTNFNSDNVSTIDTQTNQVIGDPIPVGDGPVGVAIVPNQAAVASFSPQKVARLGAPVAFDASASHDADGSVATFSWDFGDGVKLPSGGTTLNHVFLHPGTYQVILTAADNEGCSVSQIFTGQTVSCHGSSLATQTKAVKVVYPAVRIKCPRVARPKGCSFALQAVTKRRKGKVETKVTKVKVRAGKSAAVSLRPKRRFIERLGTAKRVLVKEMLRIDGSVRTTFRRLILR